VLEELVTRLGTVLGGELVGVYLQGSLAVGGFDEHSDVDFVAAVVREPGPGQVEALQTMHGQVHRLRSEWARHLEGSYFPLDILRQPLMRGRSLWYLDNGAGRLVLSDHCNTLLVRRVVRESGVALCGPAPGTLVDPVSDRMLREEILETITGWGRVILGDPAPYRNRFYQGFIVLSFCRMLHDLHEGRPGSKRAGAEWAKSVLDPTWTDLIDSAWATRPDPARSVRTPADPEAFERTLGLVGLVMEEAVAMHGRMGPDRDDTAR
jgi:hypothetical protein